jgi:4-hydroxythreonine-4-phosphate dehydrogenase
MADLPRIAVTIGDPCGIGPEVVVKALATPELLNSLNVVLVGSAEVIAATAKQLQSPFRIVRITTLDEAIYDHGTLPVLDIIDFDTSTVLPGRLSVESGRASVEWVLQAGRLAISNEVDAIATAPINKEAARLAGYTEVGHMELLQTLSGAPKVATMLVSGKLRVVHLTTHKSLSEACKAVTQEHVLEKIVLTHDAFVSWGFEGPRVGVAALNPHASDGGLIGSEEACEIEPACVRARELGINATGPVPADIVFHQAIMGDYDVVLAMYHDQGHIPIKVYGFEESVSVNLGLPFVRTSVDHGTAFDIAGKGVAIPTSMVEAVLLAGKLASGKGLG